MSTYDEGYDDGYENGYEAGKGVGYENGYEEGYTEGKTSAQVVFDSLLETYKHDCSQASGRAAELAMELESSERALVILRSTVDKMRDAAIELIGRGDDEAVAVGVRMLKEIYNM